MNTKTKRWTNLHSTVLAVCALLAPAAWASSGGPLGDTYVSPTNDALNFGNLGTIAVGPLGASNAPGNTGLFQFDLSNLPAGTTAANIGKATLTVYLNKVLVAGGLNFAEVSTPWSESAVTFATRPSGIGAFATNVPVSASGEYVTVDVTNVVKSWVSGALPNYGVEVTASLSSPTTSVVLDSKESTTTSHPAQLDITIVSQGPQGTQGTQGSQGSQGPQGLQGPQGILNYAVSYGPLPTVLVSNSSSLVASFGYEVSITLPANAKVLVASSAVLGTSVQSGGSLGLDICYTVNGGSLQGGLQYLQIQAPQNSSSMQSLTRVLGPFSAGTYVFGLCYRVSTVANSSWSLNDYIQNTVLAFN